MKSEPGFPHRDVSWLFGLIAVRAPLARVKALAAAKAKGGTRKSHAFQIADSPYSLLSWDKCQPGLATWLSKKLQTTVAHLWDEDTSGWFGYSIFKNGAELEVFQFGANYEDELGEFADELGEDRSTRQTRRKGWDVFVTRKGEDFQFRSQLVKPTKQHLLKGLAFVDARFKALQVPIPRNFPKTQETLSWPLTDCPWE